MPERSEVIEAAGRQVTITNPDKVFFPSTGHTKLDLVRYYMAVAEGAIRGVYGRPMALKRFVNGAEGEAFFQKRAPTSRPEWIETVELSFPSGRTAEEIVIRDAAQLAWIINLGCIDLNPHPVRTGDLDHPDELRIDLDPVPGISWAQIREVALVSREVLKDFGLVGWPKTSGSRGIHESAGSLEALLELSAQHEAAGFGDAPWPPHFVKQEGEPARVQLSRRKREDRPPASKGEVPAPAPGKKVGPTGRRRTTAPLIEIARAATEAVARAGLQRWRSRHAEVWSHLAPSDVMVDSMRGRNTTWTRIRINLRNVPESERPPQEPLEINR